MDRVSNSTAIRSSSRWNIECSRKPDFVREPVRVIGSIQRSERTRLGVQRFNDAQAPGEIRALRADVRCFPFIPERAVLDHRVAYECAVTENCTMINDDKPAARP